MNAVNASFRVKPFSDAVGAEIEGIDWSADVDRDVLARLRQVWLDRGFLVFHDQRLTPDRLKVFGRAFGELEEVKTYGGLPGHPEILPLVKEPADLANVGEGWHIDSTYKQHPPTGAVLYAVQIPPAGGDTLFANMYRAHDTLSEGMRRMLGGVRAVHTNGFLADTAARDLLERQNSMKLKIAAQEQVAEHPVIRNHPETGRASLYVHQLRAAGGRPVVANFAGMAPEESMPLLDYLCRHAAREEFVGRVRWQPGMLLIYDNRCLQHNAPNDYHGHRREMWRLSLAANDASRARGEISG